MSQNLYFIMSYKKNLHHGTRLRDNLIRMGIEKENIIIVLGYDLNLPETYKDKHPKLTKSKVCFHNFFDFILPLMLDSKKDCYYLEDHTIVYDNPDNYPKINKMVWLGFMKRLSDYIVGAHLVFLHKDLIKLIYDNRKNYRPCYMDRFFKKIGEDNDVLQIDKSITQIVPHFSLGLQKIRNNPKNKYFKFTLF